MGYAGAVMSAPPTTGNRQAFALVLGLTLARIPLALLFAALYLTTVVLGLFGAALTLLWLVLAHRGPQVAASDEAEAPAE